MSRIESKVESLRVSQQQQQHRIAAFDSRLFDFCFLFTLTHNSLKWIMQFSIWNIFVDAESSCGRSVTLILTRYCCWSFEFLCMPNDLLTNVTFVSFYLLALECWFVDNGEQLLFLLQIEFSIARHLKRNWKRGMVEK